MHRDIIVRSRNDLAPGAAGAGHATAPRATGTVNEIDATVPTVSKMHDPVPAIGVAYAGRIRRTDRMAGQQGGSVAEARFVFGIRGWF